MKRPIEHKLFSSLLFLFILGCTMLAHPVQAQDERPMGEQPVRVVLKDGSRLVGTILEESDDAIQFRTASGVERASE